MPEVSGVRHLVSGSCTPGAKSKAPRKGQGGRAKSARRCRVALPAAGPLAGAGTPLFELFLPPIPPTISTARTRQASPSLVGLARAQLPGTSAPPPAHAPALPRPLLPTLCAGVPGVRGAHARGGQGAVPAAGLGGQGSVHAPRRCACCHQAGHPTLPHALGEPPRVACVRVCAHVCALCVRPMCPTPFAPSHLAASHPPSTHPPPIPNTHACPSPSRSNSRCAPSGSTPRRWGSTPLACPSWRCRWPSASLRPGGRCPPTSLRWVAGLGGKIFEVGWGEGGGETRGGRCPPAFSRRVAGLLVCLCSRIFLSLYWRIFWQSEGIALPLQGESKQIESSSFHAAPAVPGHGVCAVQGQHAGPAIRS